MSYADLDGVPSQTAGISSLVASDWNTYVRDNFDSIKFGHVVVADNTAKSAISAVEGIMVYQSDVDTLFLYNGTAWVEAVDTVSLVDSAVTTAKINDLGVTTGKIAASAVTSAKIADDTIVNADVNSAAAIAYSKLNLASSVTSADIVNNTIVIGDLATALQAFLTPTGTVSAYAGSTAPTGYLLCDGTTVTSAAYPDLFNVLTVNGTVFPYGGSATTTNTPNLKGRAVIGVGLGVDAIPVTGVIGVAQGAASVTLTGAQSGTSAHGHAGSTVGTGITVTDPTHGHNINDPTHGHGVNDPSHSHNVNSRSTFTSGGSFGAAVTGAVQGQNASIVVGAGTGISINGSGTGIAINANGTGISASLASGALTINPSTEANAASLHTNIQPSMPLNYIIKV